MAITIGRRSFITLLGGVAAWPIAARAQQAAMPVIGYLGVASPEPFAERLRAFHQGLSEAGYIEGRNVAIEYRWANDRNDRLPSLAADLVRRQVTVLASLGSGAAALAAKAATTTIPIVFETGLDPVAVGLVGSLSRPGGNITGVSSLNAEIAPKRLERLHELKPGTSNIALLVNPSSPTAAPQNRDTQVAARTLGLQVYPLPASTDHEIDAAFAELSAMQAGALVITGEAFFDSRSERLAALALRHMVPAIAQPRDFPVAGGLASYGGSYTESHRQAGLYVGRILKGERPADLPVQQVTKVELIINMKTAKALGITVPLSLLATADEVLE